MSPEEHAEPGEQKEIFPPSLVVMAMRHSGYQTTAHALAELVDNSVQAEAQNIEVFCAEKQELVKERRSLRLSEIAVLDNGVGMTPEILWDACQFGNGTRLGDRKGIGRFGMGLPNSSISQCQRMDVWTWQSGPDNAIHTYLDIKEIQGGEKHVPQPTALKLPQEWRKRSKCLGTSGTLVVWSRLLRERLSWSGARTTLSHTELIVGRIHRKFIAGGDVEIRLARVGEGGAVAQSDLVRVNDPLYLTPDSSTPAPFNDTTMFQEWGTEEFPVNGHKVSVQVSWARDETLPETGNRGDRDYGKHAGKNIGVSLVRAGRELLLDAGWANSHDPTERWWGVEVNFPPELDEIFGVTLDKQWATQFTGMAGFSLEEVAEPDESEAEVVDRLKGSGDPKGHLIEVADHIRDQLRAVRRRLVDQTRGTRSEERHPPVPGPGAGAPPESPTGAHLHGGAATGGYTDGERIARLEARMEYSATKADVASLRVWILLGIFAASLLSLALATIY